MAQEEEKGRRQELTADSENLELQQQQQQQLSIWVLKIRSCIFYEGNTKYRIFRSAEGKIFRELE